MGEEFGGKMLFSRSVMSNFLWPHGLQHPRLPCPSHGENGYMYMYGWAPSLFTWNCHCLSQLTNSQLFVNWLYELSHFSHIQLFATWWTLPLQAPLSMDSAGKNTGMSCHFLLQEILLTQLSNPGLPYHRQILYHLSHQGCPIGYTPIQIFKVEKRKKKCQDKMSKLWIY